MRGSWVAIGLVTACYAPKAALDVPCAPVGSPSRCPANQICVPRNGGEFCEASGQQFDAGIDGRPDGPSNDRDGDGVPNKDDNCPDVANPDQGNEDADMIGDVCDPCPVSGDNTDTDGDGVGDDCDPNPTAGGDKIVMFEGFHHGVPSTLSATGSWTADGDEVVAAPALNTVAALGRPAFSKNETISAELIVLGTQGSQYRSVGVFDNSLNGSADVCSTLLTSATSAPANEPLLDLFQLSNGQAIARTHYVWAPMDDLVLELRRQTLDYNCDVTDFTPNPSTTAAIAGNDLTDNANASIGVYAYSSSVRLHWLLVVTSPN